MVRIKLYTAWVSLLALALSATQAPAQLNDPAALRPLPFTAVSGARAFESEHSGVFHGQQVKYRATVAETALQDSEGKPAASFFSTAYVATGKNAATRPVMFAFNGGPGA